MDRVVEDEPSTLSPGSCVIDAQITNHTAADEAASGG
jgi:hypothetical protein